MLEADSRRRWRTGTGRTEGRSEGGRFREDQSKAAVMARIHSSVRSPSWGHSRGIGGGEAPAPKPSGMELSMRRMELVGPNQGIEREIRDRRDGRPPQLFDRKGPSLRGLEKGDG